MTPLKKIAITIGNNILEQIDERGDKRSPILNRDLHRYYMILTGCVQDMANLFTENEKGLLLESLCNIIFSDMFTIQTVPTRVRGIAVEMGLSQKWDVDLDLIVRKLDQLSYIERIALADAIERWWYAYSRDSKIGVTTFLG